MNLTKVRKAFAAKIEALELGIGIIGSNESITPTPKESIEITAVESGQVVLCDDTVQYLGDVDFRIVVPVSIGTGRVDSVAEKICEAFSVIDNEKSYVKTDDGLTLLVTARRIYPGGFIDKTKYSVTVRISFQTFIKQGD